MKIVIPPSTNEIIDSLDSYSLLVHEFHDLQEKLDLVLQNLEKITESRKKNIDKTISQYYETSIHLPLSSKKIYTKSSSDYVSILHPLFIYSPLNPNGLTSVHSSDIISKGNKKYLQLSYLNIFNKFISLTTPSAQQCHCLYSQFFLYFKPKNKPKSNPQTT
jgi:hypothetical protein